MTKVFPIEPTEMFGVAFSDMKRQPLPLLVGAATTLGTYAIARLAAAHFESEGLVGVSIVTDLAGLIVASVVALAWYRASLSVARGESAELLAMLPTPDLIRTQVIASFWFWAGVFLGARYLAGLLSIAVVVFYGFYGYVVADRRRRSGLKALGESVRLGEGLRVGVFAVTALFLLLNLAPFIALGFAVNNLTIGISLAGFLLTATLSVSAGAVLYDSLCKRLDEAEAT